jgi:hypothetical protein
MVIIHVRLREGKEDDIAAWYEAQEDKSAAVRKALRTYLGLHNGETQEAVVREAVNRELARLPDVVAGAVREALENVARPYEMADEPTAPGAEDPEMAARLDAQLDDFFGG